MKVRYCSNYDKYVSAFHCEFFNEGNECEFHETKTWDRIKDLRADRKRPKLELGTVVKPYRCGLMRQDRVS